MSEEMTNSELDRWSEIHGQEGDCPDACPYCRDEASKIAEGLIDPSEIDFEQDLRWAFEKFEEALGSDARPPADPEKEHDWSDWQDAWKILKSRFLTTRRRKEILELALTEACRTGFMEPEEMKESILEWATKKVREEADAD